MPAILPGLGCRCVKGRYDLDGMCPYFERKFPDQPLPADSQSKAGEAAGKDAHQFDPNTGQPEALEDERTKVWKKIGDTCARKVAGLAIDAYPDDNPKTVFGLTKPSMSPVPPAALLHLMQAMADGKQKYGLMNWREKRVSASVYYDAAMRHLMAFWDGEDKASDSGVHHLGHAMACCCLILDAAACGNLNDDRPKAGSFSELAAAMTKKLEEK